MTSDTERAAPDAPPDPRRWRILAVALTVGFMGLLDVSIVNVAIPSIRESLETTPAAIQWVVSGYALAFGLVLVTGGRLGDAYGRRRLMIIGLIGFVAASAAAGLAPSIEWLIAARLVQGASAGLLTPQNSGLIQQLFSGSERGKAFGLFGATVSISSAIGPVVGGVIVHAAGADGWRWIFGVNVPIGLVALVFIIRLIPGRPPGRVDVRLDLVGATLLGAAVLCLLFPLVNLEGGHPATLALLLAVPVLAFGFVRWEQRVVRTGGAPLLDVGLLRRVPGYAGGAAIGTLYFAGFTGVLLVMSVFLQDGEGFDALSVGLLLTPSALGSAVSAVIAGRLVARLGRKLTVMAIVVMMSGLVLLTVLVPLTVGGQLPWPVLAVPLLIMGLGGGAVISPNFTLSLAEVDPVMGGAAGAALQTGQRIGTAIGAALLVTAYQLALAAQGEQGPALQVALVTALIVLSTSLAVAIGSLVAGRRAQARADAPAPR